MVRVVVRDQTAVKVAGDATKVVRITVGTPINLGNATSGVLTSLADVNGTTNRSQGTILQWDSASNKFIHISFDSAGGRARSQVSATDAGGDGSFSYDSGTGVFTYTGPSATDVRAHLVAGSNVTYDSSTGVISSTGPSATEIRSHFVAGTNITYDSATGVISSTASGGGANTNQGLTTDSLAQGSTNLYYKDSLSRNAISVTDAGGLGSMSYDSPTGVLTYTGPSTTEVRNQLVAGTGINYDSASGVISSTIAANAFDSAEARKSISVTDAGGGGSLSYNSTNGVITYTGISDSAIRSLITASGSILYDSISGNISFTEKSDAAIRQLFASTGGALSYDTGTGIFSVDLTNATTIDDSALVKSIFSANNSGSGAGNLGYNDGVFTFTKVSDSDIRSTITASGDLTYDSVSGNISFTQRTDSAVRKLFTASGTGLTYDSPTGAFTIDLSSATTIDDSALVKSLFSVQPSASGFGNLTYNSSNGVFTFTKVNDSDIRGALSDSNTAGTFGSVVYDENTGIFTYSGVTTTDIRAQFSAGGDLSYNEGTGQFSVNHPTMYDDSDARKSLSATNVDPSQSSTLGSGSLSYDSVTGVFTFTKVTDSDIRSAINLVDVSGDGSLTYDSAQGILTYIGPSPGEVRAHLAATDLGDMGSLEYDSSAGNIKFNLTRDSIRSIFSVENIFVTNSPGLIYDSATGKFTHYPDFTQVSIRGLISVDSAYKVGLGRLAYFAGDSLDSGGVFQYTGPTVDSINQILFGGAGNITDSNLSATGVDSGTYGSASQIPVFTVNSKGRIDSAGSVAVAGVSGVSYDSSSGLISVTTSAGTTFSDSVNLNPFTTDQLTEGSTNLYFSGKTTTDLAEGSNLYYTDSRVDTRLSSGSVGNVQITGYLRGPAEFIIDPATHGNDSGTLKVLGNLQVEGTTTTINSTTLSINDKNIVIADSAADSSALDGGGITWGGDSILDNPSLTYSHADKRFDLNRALNVNPTDGGLVSYIRSNAGSGARLYLQEEKLGTQVSGGATVGRLHFQGLNSNSDVHYFAAINGRSFNRTAGAETGTIEFNAVDSGSTNNSVMYTFTPTQLQLRKRQVIAYDRYSVPGYPGAIDLVVPPSTLGWDSQSSAHSVLIPDSSGTILVKGQEFDRLVDSNLGFNPSSSVFRKGNIKREGFIWLMDDDTNASTPTPQLYLDRRPSDSSSANFDHLGSITIRGINSAKEVISYASIGGQIEKNTDGDEDGRIVFKGYDSGAYRDLGYLSGSTFNLEQGQQIQFSNVRQGYVGSPTFDWRLEPPAPSYMGGKMASGGSWFLPDSSGTLVFRNPIHGHLVINQSDSAALKTNFINNVDSDLIIQLDSSKALHLDQRYTSATDGFVHTNTNDGLVGVVRTNRHRTASPSSVDFNFFENFTASNSDGTEDHTYASMLGFSGAASSYGGLRWDVAEGTHNTTSTYLKLDGQNKKVEVSRHLDADSATFSARVYATDSLWAGKGIMFEGTVDSFETHLSITNPTADREILLPDASGTLALAADLGSFDSLSSNLGINVATSASLTLKRLTAPLTGANEVGKVVFAGFNNSSLAKDYGQIITDTLQTTNGAENSQITLKNITGGSVMTSLVSNASVELYEAGAKKLETTTEGVSVTGNVQVSTGVTADSVNVNKLSLQYSNMIDSSLTLSSADSGHIIDTFSNTTDGTIKYLVQSKSVSGGFKATATELLVLQVGSASYITQGPTLKHGIGDSDHVLYDIHISGSTVQLLATTTVNGTTINYNRTGITI